MKALEDGGTIKGKPWLKIPTAAAQKDGGADKWAGKRAPNSWIWPTMTMVNWPNKPKPKHLWIVSTSIKGAKGKLTLLYMLTQSVRLRPHHTFATLNTMMEPRLLELGREAMAVVVRES